MKPKDVINILNRYCKRIDRGGKHYKCYLKDVDEIVVVAGSPSDNKFYKQVFRHFRKYGVYIKELDIK